MSRAKVAISLDRKLLQRVDRLVKRRAFASRSEAIQTAVKEKIERIEHGNLARESSLLDPAFERAMAEEGISEEAERWPEY
jgi:metal-responsive CopG/Arc/MetJ family transcriptional regulator